MNIRIIVRWIAALLVAFAALASVSLAVNPSLLVQARPLSTDYTVGGTCGATIQTCISNPIVQAGDRILIPAGAYTESLTLDKAISLIGADASTTIIHAVSNQRVMTVTGATISNSAVISGLTFAGGNLGMTTFSCPDDCGGGLLIINSAQPLIHNTIITGNSSFVGGGALYADAGTALTLTNIRVSNNFGGAYALGPVAVNGCTFIDNEGAGLYVSGTVFISGTSFFSNTGGGATALGSAIAINSRFENNTNLGGALSNGGGLSVNGSLLLDRTDLINNHAAGGGGGIYVFGSATLLGGRLEGNASEYLGGGLYAPAIYDVDATYFSTVTVTGTKFVSNVADFAGGGINVAGKTTIENALFENNRSRGKVMGGGDPLGGSGGGVQVYGPLTVSATIFISNSANSTAGAIYHGNVADNAVGDGRIVNTVFARNRARGDGAAIYVTTDGTDLVLQSTIADTEINPKQAIVIVTGTAGITNTIIASHTIAISQTDGTVYQDYNLFFGNTANVSGTVSGDAHDVFGNPNFVNPEVDDYHILPPSAAINAGVDAGVLTDIDGNPRPAIGGFDIGAYEYSIPSPITGLSVQNSSPTELGNLTFFTATASGTAVTYHWDFGDSTVGSSGATATHQYAAIGLYMATVTATNSISTVVVTTPVTITARPIAGLSASNSGPTPIGKPTILTATIEAGDPVTYTWNFGDGSPSATGRVVTHTYPFTVQFSFTATVVASNPVNTQMAATLVTLVPHRLYLPLLLKGN